MRGDNSASESTSAGEPAEVVLPSDAEMAKWREDMALLSASYSAGRYAWMLANGRDLTPPSERKPGRPR